MERRRRISGNDYSLYSGYVDQTHEITNGKFTCTDGVSYIKNKTTQARNIYTYADGSNITSTASSSAATWLSFKTGDIVDVILYDVHVESAGTDDLQMYTTAGSYYRYLGQMTLTANTNYLHLRQTIAADGSIAGLEHTLSSRTAYTFKLKIYVNGIRYI